MTPGSGQDASPRAGRLAALAACAYCLVIFWQAMGFDQTSLSVPLSYDGDSLQYSFVIEAFASDKGVGSIENAGAPFGTQNLDFPNADFTNLFLSSIVAGDGQFGARFNLYLLLTILLTTFSAFFTARAFGLRPAWAATAAIAFTLLPFHFWRLPHLFYTNYSAAAVSVWLALRLSMPPEADSTATKGWRKSLGIAAFVLGCVWCGSTGVYYAFFSCIVLASAGVLASFRNGKWFPAKRAGIGLLIIVGVVGLQLLPTSSFVQENGENERVAKRSLQETDLYGLRLAQLVLPIAGHRVPALARIRAKYEAEAGNINENETATLGVFGVFGLIAALFIAVAAPFRRKLDWDYELVGVLLLILFLFATVGGLGSIFSLLITPQLRALNRISPFIGLLAVLIASGVMQSIVDRFKIGILHPIAAVIAILVIVFDQVPYGMGDHSAKRSATKVRFESDRIFANSIHTSLGSGARVLQLPYIEYPESGAAIGEYVQFRNNLHAPSLHWTYGAMKGRPEASWLRLISSLPPDLFVRTLNATDFSGVVVDERGNNELITRQVDAFVASAPSKRIVSKDATQSGYLLENAPRERARALAPLQGWYELEQSGESVWMWSSGEAGLQLSPPSETSSCTATITVSALRPQRISVNANGRTLESVALAANQAAPLRFRVPADTRRITLSSDEAPAQPGTSDVRLLGFQWLIVDPPVCISD